MDCNKCRQSLPILDELEDGAAEAVIVHVSECPACRRESEEYAFLSGILGSMGDMSDIAFNWEQFAATTQRAALETRARIVRSQRTGHRWIMRFAAAAAFFFVSLALLFTALSDQTPDRESGSRLTEITAGHDLPPQAEAPPERSERIDGPLEPVTTGPGALKPAIPEELTTLEPALAEGISIRPSGTGGTRIPVWLGVLFQKRGDGKIVVARIIANGPARNAGLQPGDIIVRCNNTALKNLRALTRFITRLGPGRVVDLTVKRGESLLRITTITGRDPIL